MNNNEIADLMTLVDAVALEIILIVVRICKFIAKGGISERDFVDLFRFAEESDGNNDVACQTAQDILGIDFDYSDLGIELKQAVSLLANKKLVVCFDEARGLFGAIPQMDDHHSLVFRGVRRACRLIGECLARNKDTMVVFLYMDTNARIGNFVKPFDFSFEGIDPRIASVAEPELPFFPPFPSFSAIMCWPWAL